MQRGRDLLRVKCDLCGLRWSTAAKLSTTAVAAKKKDLLAHEKLTVCDYGDASSQRRRLYVFGSTLEGALGISTLLKPAPNQRKLDYLYRPVRNSFDGFREILDIECGHGFTLLRVRGIKQNGEATVYGTGLNTHGQLGFHAVRAGIPLGIIIRPAPLSSVPLVKENVLTVGCGLAHTVISVQGHGLLTLGNNSSGQCGRMPIPNEEYFGSRFVHHIKPFGTCPEEDVISIVSKFNVTFCLTRSGKVYSFGDNSQGQVGRGSRVIKPWEPGLVEGDLKGEFVKHLATSGSSVLAVTESGSLFGWGCNESGEVNGEDSGRLYFEPRVVPLRKKIGKIVHASLGDQFAHIVTEKGEVYTWGLGGSLGLGPRVIRVRKPMLMPPPLFGQNDLCPDVKVTKVFSGFFHTAAINSRGDLYTWGKNPSGCLGLGLSTKEEMQYFPLRVSLAGSVEKVAIGVDHTMVLCKGGI